jgi:putative PEP-CTERM system TPR-repeat lipoprotein
MQNGDAAAAARYFEQAAALDPKNVGKRTAVALSHLAKGEGERGLGELEAIAADDTGIRADLALVATNVRQRKFDAALAAVAVIEKKQPDKPLPHNLRGTVLLAKGDAPGARRSFEQAAAIDQNYFPAAANLARLDLAEKKPDEARKRFETVLVKDPTSAQALLAIAALRAQAGGSTDEVATLIGKAVTAKPTETGPRLALIAHYIKANEPKKAVAAAQEAIAALPDRPEILDAAGRAYQAAGDSNQAINTYKTLAQLRPESPVAFLRMAEIQIAANDNPAALDNLNRALVINPDLDQARRAVIALDLSGGRTKEALAAARDVQKKRPTDPVGYVLEGNIHASTKAWSEAAATYRAGLKQAASTDLAVHLHAALDAGGKGSEADGFASSWMKEHPKDRAFRLYLAQAAIGKKDYASAARQYRALLEVEPNDALALNNLAWTAGQLKDPKALEYAEKADKLSPNNAVILDTMGMLLVEKGETARGVELLQKAVALAPKAASIRLNLASALVKSGQKEAATKELDAVVKLGGTYAKQAEAAKTTLGL